MKTIPAALQLRLDQDVARLCTCWRVVRRDGQEFYFTDAVSDVTVSGQVYKAATGLNPTAVVADASYSIDNTEIESVLDDAGITAEDIQMGRYDGAIVYIFMVDYTAPALGEIKIKKGELGQLVQQRNGMYFAELRGLMQRLSQPTLRTVQAECDADLGDSRCKVVLASFSTTGTVDSVTDRRTFAATLAASFDTDYFSGGLITWSTGNNAGLTRELKLDVSALDDADHTLSTWLLAEKDIQVGDTFTVVAGCDKKRATCVEKFDNVLNFRGFPDLIGGDQIMQVG